METNQVMEAGFGGSWLLGLGLLAALVALWALWARRRPGGVSGAALKAWVEDKVAEALSPLLGASHGAVLAELRSHEDRGLRDRVAGALAGVELAFHRQGAGGLVELTLAVAPREGSLRAWRRMLRWEDTPDEVRGRMLRERARSFVLPWHPDWAGAQGGR
ncbi:MAG TPA: hypothetical protein PK668_20950 [Myxococcota bacterium]|nr:hypothetical protein [Myxococcota bacterium]HRY96619.1 hypothetical protein [Myxococcota bacterium]HSA21414.1 hypothetical protein [Myxococcota bacterium]